MLDKHTFGKSPGALYLVDILNSDYTKRERHFVCSKINTHKIIFKQLVTSFNAGHINRSAICTLIKLMRAQLISDEYEMIEVYDYAPIIADLYRGIIIGDFKQFERDN